MMKTPDARQGPKLAWFGRAWLNRPVRVYLMLRYGMKYADKGPAFYRHQYRQWQIKELKSKAASLGFQVTPIPVAA